MCPTGWTLVAPTYPNLANGLVAIAQVGGAHRKRIEVAANGRRNIEVHLGSIGRRVGPDAGVEEVVHPVASAEALHLRFRVDVSEYVAMGFDRCSEFGRCLVVEGSGDDEFAKFADCECESFLRIHLSDASSRPEADPYANVL